MFPASVAIRDPVDPTALKASAPPRPHTSVNSWHTGSLRRMSCTTHGFVHLFHDLNRIFRIFFNPYNSYDKYVRATSFIGGSLFPACAQTATRNCFDCKQSAKIIPRTHRQCDRVTQTNVQRSRSQNTGNENCRCIHSRLPTVSGPVPLLYCSRTV